MEEVKQCITDFENSQPSGGNEYLHLGFKCKKGKHRSNETMLFAAYILRMLGFIVYTESPAADRDAEKCRGKRCLCPDRCPFVPDYLHDRWKLDAEAAAEMALRIYMKVNGI